MQAAQLIHLSLRYLNPACRQAATSLCFFFALVSLALAQADFSHLLEVAQQRYGKDTARLVQQWQQEIDDMQSLPEIERLQRANRFFNRRIRWVSDEEAWAQQDYWATPLETLAAGQGDCEDFAIAKYMTLVLAGVEVSKLRITYVSLRRHDRQGPRSQAHMVLAYYPHPRAEPLILDNVVPTIHRASVRRDLTPVYGFNSDGLWLGNASEPVLNKPESRLSRWRDLLRRAQAEGLP